MKRFLSLIFVFIAALAVFISLQFDVRWNGMVAWSLAIIFLAVAAYFTKYIPDKKEEKKD